MLSTAAIIALISCSEPKLQFRDFYQKVYGVKYPSDHPEQISHVMSRIATGVADYVDCVEAYKEKCK